MLPYGVIRPQWVTHWGQDKMVAILEDHIFNFFFCILMQYWNLLPVVHVLFSMTLIKICNLCPDNGSVPNDHANQSWKTHIVIWACWVLRNKIAVTRWASFHSIQCYLKILSRKFCCGLHMLNSWNTHIIDQIEFCASPPIVLYCQAFVLGQYSVEHGLEARQQGVWLQAAVLPLPE